jgi:hypothetical protein
MERYLNRLAAHPEVARSAVSAGAGAGAWGAPWKRLKAGAVPRQLLCAPLAPSRAAAPCPQALRVWLEADGTLRSSPAWLALRPQQPTPAQVRWRGERARSRCSVCVSKRGRKRGRADT